MSGERELAAALCETEVEAELLFVLHCLLNMHDASFWKFGSCVMKLNACRSLFPRWET